MSVAQHLTRAVKCTAAACTARRTALTEDHSSSGICTKEANTWVIGLGTISASWGAIVCWTSKVSVWPSQQLWFTLVHVEHVVRDAFFRMTTFNETRVKHFCSEYNNWVLLFCLRSCTNSFTTSVLPTSLFETFPHESYHSLLVYLPSFFLLLILHPLFPLFFSALLSSTLEVWIIVFFFSVLKNK